MTVNTNAGVAAAHPQSQSQQDEEAAPEGQFPAFGLLVVAAGLLLVMRYRCSTKQPAPSSKDRAYAPVLQSGSGSGSGGGPSAAQISSPSQAVEAAGKAKAAAALAMAEAQASQADADALELGQLPLPSWSVVEVGDWVRDEVGEVSDVDAVVSAFAAAHVDGFMLSRMRDQEDLDDIVPKGKADRCVLCFTNTAPLCILQVRMRTSLSIILPHLYSTSLFYGLVVGKQNGSVHAGLRLSRRRKQR